MIYRPGVDQRQKEARPWRSRGRRRSRRASSAPSGTPSRRRPHPPRPHPRGCPRRPWRRHPTSIRPPLRDLLLGEWRDVRRRGTEPDARPGLPPQGRRARRRPARPRDPHPAGAARDRRAPPALPAGVRRHRTTRAATSPRSARSSARIRRSRSRPACSGASSPPRSCTSAPAPTTSGSSGDAIELRVLGGFAMTETGHGSDVASIATSATYDPATEEFVIHTPFRAAWKDYIGNAAVDARAAVVFAQLETLGQRHGVHAFYVPIRDEAGAFLPGVGGEDDGPKGGLNGVDNGRLHFTEVRIPRTNLLNRYGDVAPDGTYSSPIASPGRRFFTMLGTLVQGRDLPRARHEHRRAARSADRSAVRGPAAPVPGREPGGDGPARLPRAPAPPDAGHRPQLRGVLRAERAAPRLPPRLHRGARHGRGPPGPRDVRRRDEGRRHPLRPGPHPGVPRGDRRRRLPRREPLRAAARRPRRLHDVRGRQHGAARSWSASACSPTTAGSSRARRRRRSQRSSGSRSAARSPVRPASPPSRSASRTRARARRRAGRCATAPCRSSC